MGRRFDPDRAHFLFEQFRYLAAKSRISLFKLLLLSQIVSYSADIYKKSFRSEYPGVSYMYSYIEGWVPLNEFS